MLQRQLWAHWCNFLGYSEFDMWVCKHPTELSYFFLLLPYPFFLNLSSYLYVSRSADHIYQGVPPPFPYACDVYLRAEAERFGPRRNWTR